MHLIAGKEVQIPFFLKIEPSVLEDLFVWQKMARRIAEYRTRQVQKSLGELELPSFTNMKTILTQKDSRIPEYNLYRLAYKWCESQRRCFLKKHLSFIDFRCISVEQSQLVEIEPLLTSDVSYASSCQLHKPGDFSDETWSFIEKFAAQKGVTANWVLQNLDEVFQLFASSVFDDSENLDILDEYIAALVVYLRQHASSELDLFKIVCNLGRLRHNYMLSEFVREVDFVRFSPQQRRLAHIDLAPLDKQHIHRIENALHQSRILSHTDIKELKGMFDVHADRWVMYYANDQCDRTRWKQFNDILQTDTFKMIVFRFPIDGHDWVIAICIAEKLVLRDTIAVTRHRKHQTRVFVSVHDQNNDTCLTSLPHNYFLALDGHRLQIFEDNPAKDRTQTFVCLMNLDDSDDTIGMSVALNRFHRHAFSKDHNNAKIRREWVSQFEIFLNQPMPMVAPAIIVSHYDHYGLLKNNHTSTSTDSLQDFQYSTRAFPSLDEEPALSLDDLKEELQKIELEYYELMQKITANQPVENKLHDWLDRLRQPSSEVKCRTLIYII